MKDFTVRENIISIDLIKIDVGTHEPEVLEGMEDLIKLYKPTFLIEILNDEVALRIQKIIDGLKYLYFDINENNKIEQVENLKKSSYFNYLICQKNIAQELGLLNLD